MHKAIYEKLKETAKNRQTVTYTEIAPLAGLDMSIPVHRDQIGDLLGEISETENKNDRPMLSVIVIHRNNNMPGKGFFKLAKELGLYSIVRFRDDISFFSFELNRVFDYWKV